MTKLPLRKRCQQRYTAFLSTLATAGLRLLELTHGDHLLRFITPLEADLEAGEGASIWIPELEIGASGSSTEEAIEMLGDLVITMYLTHRSGYDLVSPQAQQQWQRLQAVTEGLFVRQA
jgi:hypothetical protein